MPWCCFASYRDGVSVIGYVTSKPGESPVIAIFDSRIMGDELWTDTQALRRLMANLRRKIEKDPAIPEFIITEIGLGYRFLD
ncbi:helix-turn-helix domain-containing protein [Erysipelothrix sp. D19-032]